MHFWTGKMSAPGHKRALGPAMFYVRFNPESRHERITLDKDAVPAGHSRENSYGIIYASNRSEEE